MGLLELHALGEAVDRGLARAIGAPTRVALQRGAGRDVHQDARVLSLVEMAQVGLGAVKHAAQVDVEVA